MQDGIDSGPGPRNKTSIDDELKGAKLTKKLTQIGLLSDEAER
jgi:hypothetical protein